MSPNAIVRWSNPEVILVATNLLEGHNLILHAIYQAKLSGAKVLLVHVVPPSYSLSEAPNGMPFILPSPMVRNVKAKLDGIAENFRREDVECEPIVLTGLPGEQISRLVRSRSVDRVIVATRNTTGVARLVEESVAEEMIAALEVPVCVIGRRTHPGAACGTPLTRILLATSFHSGSALLARFSSTLAEVNHSRLVLLHVLETSGMSEQHRELAKFEARKRLSDLVPKEARHWEEPSYVVREGDPASVISAEAGSIPQDLVILGSPHPSVASWLLGTGVAHRVVIESECPVITIKTQAASELLHDNDDSEAKLVDSRAGIEASIAID